MLLGVWAISKNFLTAQQTKQAPQICTWYRKVSCMSKIKGKTKVKKLGNQANEKFSTELPFS